MMSEGVRYFTSVVYNHCMYTYVYIYVDYFSYAFLAKVINLMLRYIGGMILY